MGHIVIVIDNGNYSEKYREPVPFRAKVTSEHEDGNILGYLEIKNKAELKKWMQQIGISNE